MSRWWRLLALGLILTWRPALGQPATIDATNNEPATIFDHPTASRLWLSGQINTIFQWHPGFHSPYSGANSLSAESENATSY
ncbi:MAG TPA: porin, partial [Candidatus Kryptonia bacterium]|nr:porin [Candidatus Kryptonia bacterium]